MLKGRKRQEGSLNPGAQMASTGHEDSRLPGHKAEHHQKSATAAASLLPPSPAFFCVPTCFFLDAVKKTYNSQLYSLLLSKNNFLTPCVASIIS